MFICILALTKAMRSTLPEEVQVAKKNRFAFANRYFFHFKMCHDRKNHFNSTTKSLGHHNLKVD